MKRLLLLGMALALAATLAGCGGGSDNAPTVFVQTFSNLTADGDIARAPDNTFTFSQDIVPRPASLFFGLDGTGTEFRAFLDFPLDGSNGGGVVPLSASIVSADIEVFVDNVILASTVPTLLDLVPFPTAHLTNADFDSAPLATRPPFGAAFSFSALTDINNFVRIDVTSLMREAQRQQLSHFQVRFLLDFTAVAGLVEIADGASFTTAPILTVEYF